MRFEIAVVVFDDPYAITQRDCTFDDAETLDNGWSQPVSILLIVHAFYEGYDEGVIPTSSHGSKPTAPAIRPKPIGFCDRL